MIRYALFLFIIVGLIFRAFLMKDVAFYDWDEGFYSVVAKEIVERKSLEATFNGELWLDKPALSHYQIAALFAVTQDHELSSRMLMVFYASLLLILLYYLNRKVLQHFFLPQLNTLSQHHRDLIFMLPVIITSGTPVFLERSTILNTDVMLACAWVGYFLMSNKYWWKLFFLWFGTLTKSLVGLYPLVFEVLNLKSLRTTPRQLVKAGALLVVPLMWHIFNYVRFGQTFLHEHVFEQVVKRVIVPIELHFGIIKFQLLGKEYEFGDKLYYQIVAWMNFNVFIFVIALGYLIILNDVFHFSTYRFDVRSLWKRFKTVYQSEDWWFYLILGSAVPYFLLLAYTKSKVAWYFVSIVPLLALVIPYVYMKINNHLLQKLLIFTAAVFFVSRFIPQTYALKITSDNRHDRIRVAECVRELPHEEVAMLVDAQERQTHNVLEAAHLQTESSFIHGGSPSFVYYVDKKVHFYYKPEDFIRDFNKHGLVILSKDDVTSGVLNDVSARLEEYNKETTCYFGPWQVYSKK